MRLTFSMPPCEGPAKASYDCQVVSVTSTWHQMGHLQGSQSVTRQAAESWLVAHASALKPCMMGSVDGNVNCERNVVVLLMQACMDMLTAFCSFRLMQPFWYQIAPHRLGLVKHVAHFA